MKRLTADHLVKLKACHSQVILFRETFPKGAPITTASLAKAQKAGLDWGWLASNLTGPAWAEYERIKGSAWAEYERIKGSARDEYRRIQGPALLAALQLMED